MEPLSTSRYRNKPNRSPACYDRDMTTIDTNHCPLCQQINHCKAGTPEADNCWCHSASFNPDNLDKIPPKQRGKRCICPSCAGVNYWDHQSENKHHV